MKKAKIWAAALVLAAILLRPESAVAGAQRAMRLWCSSVAPALFPFLALMPMLTGPEACKAYNAALSRIMGPAFGLPGAAAPAVVIGLISGSPGGALAARRVAAQAKIPAADAKRLALALSGVSPAYLIMGVGLGLYGSAKLGLRLALIQAAVQIILLILLRGSFQGEQPAPPPGMEAQEANPISMAVEHILVVCGYMVLFSAVACVLASFFGPAIGGALLLSMDLPSGLAQLAQWDAPGKLLIQGAAIGFGGLCIAAQNLDALKPMGARWREYLGVRAVAAVLVACISGLALKPHGPGMEIYAGGANRAYAFSLLFAGIATLPGLILLSRALFFNNRPKSAKAPVLRPNDQDIGS